VLELLAGVDHTETRAQGEAERSFLLHLSADCHTPVAGWARVEGDALTLSGLVGSLDGETVLTGRVTGPAAMARRLGEALAADLLGRGARQILEAARGRGA
jgi:hydroxymethylbilane synthase